MRKLTFVIGAAGSNENVLVKSEHNDAGGNLSQRTTRMTQVGITRQTWVVFSEFRREIQCLN